MERISRRGLNRATLARQHLLERTTGTAVELVHHLVGLQAQTPQSWYVGVWSRLANFDADELSTALEQRQVVRIAAMRSTIHLLTADDALALRPLTQPALDRAMQGNFGKRLAGIDRDELTKVGHELLSAEPRTFAALRPLLAERYPDRDPEALVQGVRAWVPLVQVPPRGLWRCSGKVAVTSADRWLGRAIDETPDVDAMVLRYLRAFGPASVKDVQTWCGLTRLKEVVDRNRDNLVAFTTEDGVELVDLPDAPRPPGDIDAPIRFLYDYDNLLLSHADRSRVITDDFRRQDYPADGIQPSTILVDGFTSAAWTVTQTKTAATLDVRPFRRLTKPERDAVTAEAARLLTFLAREAAHEIRMVGSTA